MMAFDLPVPAIILPVENGLWGDADRQMQRLGLPRHVRRAIQKELQRVVGARPSIQRATLDDLARYAGEPKLGMFPFPTVVPTGTVITGPTISGPVIGNTGDSFNIGTASADRVVIAMALGDRGATTPRTLTALTYDGAAGSSLVTTGVGGTTNSVTVGMSSKLITTGTTVTVAATYSGAVAVSKIYVYTIKGQLSNTPGDTKTWKTGDAAVTINVANAGCVLMLAGGIDGTLAAMTLTGVNSNDDQTWTGVVGMRGAVGSVSNLAAEAARSLAVSSTANAHAFVAHTYS